MKSVHQQQVELLMSKIPGQDVPTSPTMPDEKTRLLRAKLILEEALETIEALGFEVHPIGEPPICIDDLMFEPNGLADLVKVVDGCCDIAVVTTGTLSAFGVDDVEPQDMVNRANLRKFGPGGYLREDGKWIKPPDFVGPDGEIREWLSGLYRLQLEDLNEVD